MGYPVSIYRRLAFWLILFSNACIQKQDALIISAKNSEPFIQVRCILVPGFEAQVNSKKVTPNPNIEWQGNISYIILGSDGSVDSIVILQNDYREYFSFTGIKITEGVSYTLVCRSNLGEVIQEVYIPKKLEDIIYEQSPYENESLRGRLDVQGSNINKRTVYILNPVSTQLFSNSTNQSNMRSLYGDTTRIRSLAGISLNPKFGNFSTRIKKLSSLEYYKDYIDLSENVYYSYDQYFDPSVRQQFATPFHLNSNREYVHLYQEEDTNRYFQNAMVICDDRTVDLLRNIPEYINEESVPAFSNIPAYPLNINEKGFKGYLIGYTFNEPPLIKITDVSQSIVRLELVKKDGSIIKDNEIASLPRFIQISYRRNESDLKQIAIPIFGYSITQLNKDMLAAQFGGRDNISSLKIEQVLAYNLTNKEILVFNTNIKAFETLDNLFAYFNGNEVLTFYED